MRLSRWRGSRNGAGDGDALKMAADPYAVLRAQLEASLKLLESKTPDLPDFPVDEERIVRYRRMGYSGDRIAVLFGLPFRTVYGVLVAHRLGEPRYATSHVLDPGETC